MGAVGCSSSRSAWAGPRPRFVGGPGACGWPGTRLPTGWSRATRPASNKPQSVARHPRDARRHGNSRKVAGEDGTLTRRDARIAAKRIDTIETLQTAADDPPAQIIQKGLAGTRYKNALEQSDNKRRLDKLDNIEELVADAQLCFHTNGTPRTRES